MIELLQLISIYSTVKFVPVVFIVRQFSSLICVANEQPNALLKQSSITVGGIWLCSSSMVEYTIDATLPARYR